MGTRWEITTGPTHILLLSEEGELPDDGEEVREGKESESP